MNRAANLGTYTEALNLVGKRFGRLIVKMRMGTNRTGASTWLCVCDCGRLKLLIGSNLNKGNTNSCGCFRREELSRRGKLRFKHGLTRRGQVSAKYTMWKSAKTRAKRSGIVFDLNFEDIQIPEFCPILGIRLVHAKGKPDWNSPSLDRIELSHGYVKDNVWVISQRANLIKNNATLDELKKLVAALEKRLSA